MNFRDHKALFITIDVLITIAVLGMVLRLTTASNVQTISNETALDSIENFLQPTEKISVEKKMTADVIKKSTALEISGTFPQFTATHHSQAIRALNAYIQESVSSEYANFITQNLLDEHGAPIAQTTNDPDEQTMMESSFEIESLSSGFSSIFIHYYWFMTGAQHPNAFDRTLNYDLAENRAIKLSDLFLQDSGYVKIVSRIAHTALAQRLNNNGSAFFEDGATPTEENFANFFIKDGQLVIHFSLYQVAPYSEGPQDVVIPRSAVKNILSDYGKKIIVE